VKVQIIYLDTHDDHVSARDKLGWVKAPRVLIVWPNRGRVLTRRLDLVLLQRLARQHSTQIGLVTHDPDVIGNADALGIPVFASLDRIPDKGWRRDARTVLRKSRPKRPDRADASLPLRDTRPTERAARLNKIFRPLSVLLAITGLFCLAATLVPSAEITLSPPIQTQEIDISITLDPDVVTPSLDGRIPAYRSGIRVDDSLHIPTSGTVAAPAVAATGSVTFTNLTSEPVTLPKGTGLRASEVEDLRFVTTESVELAGEESAQGSAQVECTSAGSDGNLPAGQIDAIEGPLGLSVTVTNEEALSGGSNEARSSVTSSDRRNLERDLTEQLIALAESELTGGLDSNETMAIESLHLAKIHEKSFDHQVGEPADNLSLYLDIEIEGLVYQPEDIETCAAMVLEDQRATGIMAVPGTLVIELLSEPFVEGDGGLSWDITVSQQTYTPADEASLKEMLRAKTPQEAALFLQETLELSSPPIVHLFPSWLPRLPWIGMRISLINSWEVE
jgi:hypothetical protein